MESRLKEYALKTISPKAFFPIVLDAVKNRQELSVVRACDGEKMILDQCIANGPGLLEPLPGLDESWLVRYGVQGIDRVEMYRRLTMAGNNCNYFAPSVSGLTMRSYCIYDYFNPRPYYIDNFFVNDWTWEMKQALFQAAGHVLFINYNPHTADSMQLRVQANLSVKVSFIRLSNWKESQGVIEKALKSTAPLVLFSGGPASKYIGPLIAKSSKVVLDLGAAAQHWTFEHLEANRDKAEAFHKEWSKDNVMYTA